MSTMAPVQPIAPEDAHKLQCMEVWGGSTRADHAASVPGLDLYVHSTPYTEDDEAPGGGGDVYYISRCGSGRVTRIALADVAGHGSGVHELAEKLRRAMRKSVNIANQSKLARSLNRTFDSFNRGERFATALLGTYFAPTDHFVFVNAGHPPPFLRKHSSGEWVGLDGDTEGVLTDQTPAIGIRNLPLGVIDSTDYLQLAYKLEPGDCVLMYTDAYSESLDPDGKMIGPDGFLKMLRSLDAGVGGPVHPSRMIDAVNDAITSYRGAPAEDDQTLVLMHHNGTNPEKLSLGEKFSILGQVLGLGRLDTVPS